MENKGEKEKSPSECRVPENSKERLFFNEQCKVEENNRMGKTRRSLQENWRDQGNISCKDGLDKGQKRQEPNRSRRN